MEVHHLPFSGDVYVLKSGLMCASLKFRPVINGGEAFTAQLQLFKKYMGAELVHEDSFLVSLSKSLGQYETYGHSNQNNRLTFVLEEPNRETGLSSLYKIHTRKLKNEERIEGNSRISRLVPDPISPLEIITRSGGKK